MISDNHPRLSVSTLDGSESPFVCLRVFQEMPLSGINTQLSYPVPILDPVPL